MRTDTEIKEFIDSKEVLTRKELGRFLYPTMSEPVCTNTRVRKWWGYVLETKNWEKLRKYRDDKINKLSLKYDFLPDIFKKDKRFKEVGYRRGIKILKEIYNVTISNSTMKKKLKEFRNA